MKENSGVLILNTTISFSIPVHRMNFFSQFGPEISKYFVWNEAWYKGLLGGTDSEIGNCFLSSVPKLPLWRKFWSQNFKVLCFKSNILTWTWRKCKPDAYKNMSAVVASFFSYLVINFLYNFLGFAFRKFPIHSESFL